MNTNIILIPVKEELPEFERKIQEHFRCSRGELWQAGRTDPGASGTG